MGRPRTGVDNNAEKTLTRVICQEVFLASGLTMSELETVFSLGTVDSFGRKTSKTFSRYCESDPSKSRAAPRDTLQKIVRVSIERGWLQQEQVDFWRVNQVLMLNHQRASQMFESRKLQRDELVSALRKLRDAAAKVRELNESAQFTRATLCPKNEQVWEVHQWLRNRNQFQFVLDGGEDSLVCGLPEHIAPIDLQGVLKLLAVCLEQTQITFGDGVAIVPMPDQKRLETKNPIHKFKVGDNDFSDIDELMKEVQESMKLKTGAIVVQ